MAGPKATKKHKFVKAWVHEHVNDHWVKEATRLGYRSRAAFKLIELAEKDQLFRPGMSVVDLGSAPGSWAQVLHEKLGAKARIVAIDLLPMDAVRGVAFIQGDFREPEGLAAVEAALEGRKVDLVVSDLAPNLSGVEAADQARAVHLGELALEFAGELAATGRRSGRQSFPGRRICGIPAVDPESFRQGLRPQAEGIARPQPRGLSGGEAAAAGNRQYGRRD